MGQESASLSVGLEDELIMQPVGWHTSLQPPLPVAGVQKSRGKRCLAGWGCTSVSFGEQAWWGWGIGERPGEAEVLQAGIKKLCKKNDKVQFLGMKREHKMSGGDEPHSQLWLCSVVAPRWRSHCPGATSWKSQKVLRKCVKNTLCSNKGKGPKVPRLCATLAKGLDGFASSFRKGKVMLFLDWATEIVWKFGGLALSLWLGWALQEPSVDAALVAVKDREIFGTALLRGISEMSVGSSLGAGMRGVGTLLFIYSKSIRNGGNCHLWVPLWLCECTADSMLIFLGSQF